MAIARKGSCGKKPRVGKPGDKKPTRGDRARGRGKGLGTGYGLGTGWGRR